MGKKHKHEEHVNHERWLVSFADMMTLLFALFVVLYALGQADLEKAKLLKNSIQWAFHIAGEGKTKDEGVFDQQTGGGDVLAGPPLITAQDGEMREFLKEQLEKYEDVAGKSLTIVQTDDTVAFTAPITDFFDPERPWPVKREVGGWLEKTLVTSLTFASNIQVEIKAPDVPIGRDRGGRVMTSIDLTIERLRTMARFVQKLPEVRGSMVKCGWSGMDDDPGQPAWRWEERSTISVAFSNTQGGR
ncbi:MAG: hypothetical protein KDC98_21320 [Planctomycetes bacterium]|nr:hypothetical protein [Planctomycetota bacterium]